MNQKQLKKLRRALRNAGLETTAGEPAEGGVKAVRYVAKRDDGQLVPSVAYVTTTAKTTHEGRKEYKRAKKTFGLLAKDQS